MCSALLELASLMPKSHQPEPINLTYLAEKVIIISHQTMKHIKAVLSKLRNSFSSVNLEKRQNNLAATCILNYYKDNNGVI